MIQPPTQLPSEPHSSRRLTIGGAIFDEGYLLELAKTSEFYKRPPRKIDICSLLAAICAEGIKGSPSCNDLAANIETSHPEHGPSRQAADMKAPLENFIHQLLEDIITGRLASGP